MTSPAPPAVLPAPISFPALGTTAVLQVVEASVLALARVVLEAELDAMDRAASRFRPDSELLAVSGAGRPVPVSALLLEAVLVARRAAVLTDGRVDPTVGTPMAALGYDRDFATIDREGPALQVTFRPAAGWPRVLVDPEAGTIEVPAGVTLDLGATAKALCADRAASAIRAATGSGVLVSLGGDVAVAGPAPDGGWPVRVCDDHRKPDQGPTQTVTITDGGLATSGITARRWTRGDRVLHHLIDPATGEPVDGPWRTVTVAAGSCVDANIASTAAIVLGPDAPAWLVARGLPARLVDLSGGVHRCGSWPEEAPTGADPPARAWRPEGAAAAC